MYSSMSCSPVTEDQKQCGAAVHQQQLRRADTIRSTVADNEISQLAFKVSNDLSRSRLLRNVALNLDDARKRCLRAGKGESGTPKATPASRCDTEPVNNTIACKSTATILADSLQPRHTPQCIGSQSGPAQRRLQTRASC